MRIWETRLREYSGRISVRLEILPFYLRESSKSLLCSIALNFFRRTMGLVVRNPATPKLEWDSSLQITIFMLRHRSAAASENESPLSFHALLCLFWMFLLKFESKVIYGMRLFSWMPDSNTLPENKKAGISQSVLLQKIRLIFLKN